MILTYNDSMPKDNFSDEAENLYLRKILSTNIRNLRAKYHLTQERLAENAEISLPYLSDIEHCKTWVSDKTLIKLAKALHSEPSQLLEDTNLLSNKINHPTREMNWLFAISLIETMMKND